MILPVDPTVCAIFGFKIVGVIKIAPDDLGFVFEQRAGLDAGLKLLLKRCLACINAVRIGLVGEVHANVVVAQAVHPVGLLAKLVKHLLLLTGCQLAIALAQLGFELVQLVLALEKGHRLLPWSGCRLSRPH